MNHNDLNQRLKTINADEDRIFESMDNIINNKQNLIIESERVATMARNSDKILREIEQDFANKTSITNKTDLAFLGVATALQCLRWIVLNKLTEKSKAGEGNFEKWVKEHYQGTDAQIPTPYHASLAYITGNPTVPYDAVAGTKLYNVGGKGGLGGNHRYKTLGHDPALGFVFGTSNILTSTITNNRFQTFHVMQKGNRVIDDASTLTMFTKVSERIVEEPQAFGAAVIKQGLHIATDVYTKEGIPPPFITSLNDDLARTLGAYAIDTGSILKARDSVTFALLIDSIISAVHALYWNEDECTLSQYEVRTRKILSVSKSIAEGSNIIVAAATQDVNNLDFGGIIYTLYRLINDIDFITHVRVEYMSSEFNKIIMNPSESVCSI